MSPPLPRIAARVLVVSTAALAALIAVVAFMPGTEVRTRYGTEIRQAGGMLVALLAIGAVFPGMFAWVTPTPRALWRWTAIALVPSLLLYRLLESIHSQYATLVWWPAPTVEAAVWAIALTSVMGSYLVGFAAQASAPRRGDESPELAARLRRLVVGVAGLGVVLLGVSLLTGQRVYTDAHHCLAWMENQTCMPSYTELRDSYVAGGGPRLALYLFVVLTPAWPLYRDPRARFAWQWFAAGIAGSVIAGNLLCYLELAPDAISRTVTLWPTRVVELGVAAMQAVLLLGLPVILVRSRALRVPVARLVQRDRAW